MFATAGFSGKFAVMFAEPCAPYVPPPLPSVEAPEVEVKESLGMLLSTGAIGELLSCKSCM